MRKLLVGLVMVVLFSLGALAGTTVFDQITLTTLTDGTLTITGGAITGISGLSFTGDLDITGDTTQTGSLTLVGNLSVDATTASIDGATSVDLISAGHIDAESADIRLGLDADDYMKLVTTDESGNLAITHPGNTPAVTWTATSFDFVGTMALDATTLSDKLTFSDDATIDNSDANTLTLTETTVAIVGIADVTGNLAVDGTTVSLDGSTSVRGISAGFTSLEAPAMRFGYDAADYMQFAVTTGTGDTVITHTGTNKSVTWTAAGGFDLVGALAVDAVTAVGNMDITGTFATDGDTAVLDGSTHVKLLSATLVDVESADIRLGLNATEYMKLATTVTSGNLAITHPGKTPAVTWAAASFGFTGNFTVDATTTSLDGSTSAKLISAALIGAEAPDIRLGYSDSIYMKVAVANTSGDTTITHTGATPDVGWTADSLTFTGAFEVVGASTLDAITSVGNLSVDATTSLIDGATSVRGVSAGFTSLEAPANRFGVNATEYMSIATTATSGDTAITHTGATPDVTWAADSLTFTGVFEVVGASTLDAITSVGNLSVDGTTALVDGSTSVRGVSAGFTSLEAPDIRFGYSDTIYTKFAVANTTGNLTITHVGGGTDLVTWTAAGGFDFVGAIALDSTTLSNVLTFSDGGTIDNTDATTLTLTEDNIVLTGDTSVTSTNTFAVGSNPVMLNHRHRVTVAEINAGHEILPAIAGRTYRIVDFIAIAYGGAVGTTTTVDILGTQAAGGVKLATFAQAQLTQSAVLTVDSTGVTVLADGATFIPCDAATAITVGKTGGDADTATGVDFIITYVIE